MSLPPLEGINEYDSFVDNVTDAYHTASISITTVSGSIWGSFYSSSGSGAFVQQVTASADQHFFEATTHLSGSISAFFIPIKRVIE